MINLSLSGCGFLGIYHIGVISAFKEHAAEVLQEKISGCSAGSLVAACAACDCCLGQMVSDVLEIALKARSHALGPLHPSFNIVDILRNGLRRILPVDAHKICSGKVHISLTRWRDGKNFLVNQFDSREELIQALICSTFIPCYSGFVPPKFKGTYYWDGGLSNNNPILDQDTILVSPFGGEADICPRDESASYYCYDFQGTNLQWSYENIYRISKALFPPNPEVLKAMCFRGYKDAINFLKSRNLLQCSCSRFREKTSISSMFGEHLNGFTAFDINSLNDDESMYDSEEENLIQYAQSVQNEPLAYQEMPVSVCEILDAACDDNKGLINYVYDSQLSRAISIMFLPWTLPFEFSLSFTKRVLELVPKFNVPSNPSNIIDTLIIFLNYVIDKLTYDRYQYHSRVTCKLCLPRNAMSSVCRHNGAASLVEASGNQKSTASLPNNSDEKLADMGKKFHSNQLYYPKICARHRVPSLCSSETGVASGSGASLSYRFRRRKTNRSLTSNASDIASSVDLNEYKSSKLVARRRQKYDSFSTFNNLPPTAATNANSVARYSHSTADMSSSNFKKSLKSLDDGSQLNDKINILLNSSHNQTHHHHHHHHHHNHNHHHGSSSHHHHHHHPKTTNKESSSVTTTTTTTSRVHFHLNPADEEVNEKPAKLIKTDVEQAQQSGANNNDPTAKSKPDDTNNNLIIPIEWESYWDNLEYNALGRVNLEI